MRRNKAEKKLADYERTGRNCKICGFADYRDGDHRLTAYDANYPEDKGQ